MRRSIKRLQGFSFIELVITVVILGGLAAIAIPAYLDYMRRLGYSEIITDVPKFQTAVTDCFHDLKTMKGCSGGKNHIPADVIKPSGVVASIVVVDGVITVTPVEKNGVKSVDTYVSTPKIVNREEVTWVSSGGGVVKGYAN